MWHTRKEIKWNRYGRLTALWERRHITTPKWKDVLIEKCVCECWKEKWIRRCNLLNWLTKSCWCLRDWYTKWKPSRNRTHWMTRTRIYKIYYWARERCNNKKNNRYNNYWGRGIKFLWNSFEEFYKDMWESYDIHVSEFGEKNTTIDRIDTNWNYCKDNCRRATMKEQQNNRSNNLISNK